MTYHITAWTDTTHQTLIVSFDTKEEAFTQAKDLWSNELRAITIEEVSDSDWPRRWRLQWPIGGEAQIRRVPNDRCDVGYHLVAALINGDVSGLDAGDEHHLEEFVAQYPDCVFDPEENEDGHIEESFARCDVTGKYNNCVRIKVFGSR